MLDRLQRVPAGDLDLPHVADVEQPGAGPHGHVLVDQARVFDGHVPAAELDHPRAERPMPRIEWSLLEGVGNSFSHRGSNRARRRTAAESVETQNGTMRIG